MRILILSENYPPETNAPAARISERNRYWIEQGHEVTVVTQAPNFPTGKVFAGYRNRWYHRESLDGVSVVRVKTYIAANEGFLRRILDFISFMHSGFCAALFEKRSDVVVGCSPQFFAAVAAWAVARVRRCPFVFEVADLWPASIRAVGVMERSRVLNLLEKVELFLYRQAAAVVALSPSIANDIVRRGVSAHKVHPVINGVDQSLYVPQPKDQKILDEWRLRNKFVVGYIGTLGMAHGLRNVLLAAEILRERDDIRFLFVGTGAERPALIAEAEQRAIANIVFVPRQPKERIPSFWSVCDLALIHLKKDSVFSSAIPSKMFEAMAMQLPLLFAGPKGDASSIVEQERAGVLVEPENPSALAEAVSALVANPARVLQLGQNSLRAAPRYSRAQQAEKMLAVLRSVVTTSPSANTAV
jgi:glycosyltransferase involved in cell wall biosynthesis